MRLYIKKYGLLVCVAFIAACQPSADQQDQVTNGMVLTGEMEGSAFAIAEGNEVDLFMKMVEAFNNMDVDALWAFSADTITFHTTDGYEGPFTKADMAGLFSTVDSLRWELDAVIPVKAVGSDLVNIMADGREIIYFKDGTVERKKLFERFIFEDQVLIGVRQWEAAMPGEGAQ